MKFERDMWREERSYASGTVVRSRVTVDGKERALQMFIEDETQEEIGYKALENGYFFIEQKLAFSVATQRKK